MIKKVFCAIALALCVVSASAQDDKKSSLLIYAGPQYSTANSGMALSTKISYLAGLQYERDAVFGEDFGLFGGVEYSAKGVKDMTFFDGSQATFEMNYVQVNLGVKYTKEFWGIEGFGFAGPYVAYGIGGDAEFAGYELEDGSFGDVHAAGTGRFYTDGGAGMNKFDLGFNIGLGAEWKGFRLMAGYQQGLLDLADDHVIADGGFKNFGFYLKAGYAFKF